MSFKMTYHERNVENIEKLGDKTKQVAKKWYEWCVKNKIDILIYETIRTKEQQMENIKKGVSQTMRSYHLVGQALDFVPVINGKVDWNGYSRPEIKKAIAYAKSLGFTWGGDWKTLVDKPHLQYDKIPYGADTFNGKSVSSSDELPLSKGEKGNKVKELQTKLNQLGYKLVVDGIFGNATEKAVKDFQKANGLVVDGIVGEKTWGKLLTVIEQKSKSTPTNSYVTYKVKRGDTLWALAKQYQTTVNEIKKLNNLKSDTIYVGQTLKLPNKYAPVYYTVKKGDTVWEIAKKYGVSIEQIKKLNNLKNYTIYPNQKLRIK